MFLKEGWLSLLYICRCSAGAPSCSVSLWYDTSALDGQTMGAKWHFYLAFTQPEQG